MNRVKLFFGAAMIIEVWLFLQWVLITPIKEMENTVLIWLFVLTSLVLGAMFLKPRPDTVLLILFKSLVSSFVIWLIVILTRSFWLTAIAVPIIYLVLMYIDQRIKLDRYIGMFITSWSAAFSIFLTTVFRPEMIAGTNLEMIYLILGGSGLAMLVIGLHSHLKTRNIDSRSS